MSRSTGPIRVVTGAAKPNPVDENGNSSSPSNSLIVQSGTREAGTAADAFVVTADSNSSSSVLVQFKSKSHSQNSIYSIQDSGQATANVVTSGTLVAGNIPQASTTGGYVVDSGVPVANLVQSSGGSVSSIAVVLSTAQVTGAYATPVQVIAAPGSGKVILIQELSVYTASTGNTAYASGGVGVVQYGNTVHGAGTNALTATVAAANITAASSQVIGGYVGSNTALTGVSNSAVYFSNQTGAFTNGTGTNVTLYITYQVVSATV